MKPVHVMYRETIGLSMVVSAAIGGVLGHYLAGAPAIEFQAPSVLLCAGLGINWSRLFGRVVKRIEERGPSLVLSILTGDVDVRIADVIASSTLSWRADFVSLTLDVRHDGRVLSFMAPGTPRSEAQALLALINSSRSDLHPEPPRRLSLRDRSLWTSALMLALTQGGAFGIPVVYGGGVPAIGGVLLGVASGVAVAIAVRLLAGNRIRR